MVFKFIYLIIVAGEMEGLTLNSYSRRLDSYISVENSKWLAENIEGKLLNTLLYVSDLIFDYYIPLDKLLLADL